MINFEELNALPVRELRRVQYGVLLARGAQLKDIARVLHLSENTIKTNLRNMYKEYGVESRAQFMAWHYENYPSIFLVGVAEPIPLGTPWISQILHHLARGKSREFIARDLHVHGSTVKRHIAKAFRLTGTRTQAELISWAYGHGLLTCKVSDAGRR